METISDLGRLLKDMRPTLSEERYFMATVDESRLMALANYLSHIICIFKEREGLTVVFSEPVKEELASMSESDVVGPFAMITLNVYSDLMAVGFLAKVTEALAAESISVNAFSAFHHDHLLVPYGRKDEAIAVLRKLSQQ